MIYVVARRHSGVANGHTFRDRSCAHAVRRSLFLFSTVRHHSHRTWSISMRLRTVGQGLLAVLALLHSFAIAVEDPLESETRGWQPPRVVQGPLRDNQVGFRACTR